MRESGFAQLAVASEHGLVAGALPPHHGDLFDRLLVAQALTEGLKLVTNDRAIAPYGVDAVWA